MSRRVLEYEGEGRHRRAKWSDPIEPIELPAHPPGPVERRVLTPEELAARGVAPAPSPIARVDPPATTRRPAMGSPEHVQQSRQRGARRHVEVMAERRAAVTPPPEEEPVMPEPEPTPVAKPFDSSVPAVDIVDVELVMPCGGCVHEAVCAIRRGIQPGVVQLVTIPLDPALSIAPPSVVIECGHFLRPAADPPATAEDPTRTPAAALAAFARDRAETASKGGQSAHRAAGEGPGPDGLTKRQAEVLAVVVRHDGNRRAASTELRVAYQTVDAVLEAIARRGRLPVELIAKLPARFAQYRAAEA